jgi:hypothetical protein
MLCYTLLYYTPLSFILLYSILFCSPALKHLTPYSPPPSSSLDTAKYCNIGMSYDPAEQLDHGGMIFPGRHVLPNYNPGKHDTDAKVVGMSV